MRRWRILERNNYRYICSLKFIKATALYISMCDCNEDFITCMLNNSPLVLKVDWKTHSDLSTIQGFCRLFGEGCNASVDIRDADAARRTLMPLSKFNEKMRGNKEDSNSYYLKDVHIQRIPCSCVLFNMPELFKDDWLDMYYSCCTNSSDDYTFLYCGGPGSWTGLHFDVLCSYSVSTNITGSKLWKLWPPSSRVGLNDRNMSYDSAPPRGVLESPHLTITQRQGETIFVPSGWYHTVTNLDPCVISINKNWYPIHLSQFLVVF